MPGMHRCIAKLVHLKIHHSPAEVKEAVKNAARGYQAEGTASGTLPHCSPNLKPPGWMPVSLFLALQRCFRASDLQQPSRRERAREKTVRVASKGGGGMRRNASRNELQEA